MAVDSGPASGATSGAGSLGMAGVSAGEVVFF